ncbi:MAG: Kinesin [Thelocarpon superellum]|nr:MAG: Kinesin [Thelocarpon superellum]
MYLSQRLRYAALLTDIHDRLTSMSMSMSMAAAVDPRALEPRAFEPRAFEPRAFPGVSADMRPLKSSASSPSLRSRDSTLVPISRPETPNGGGGETERGAECLVEMDPASQATTLLVPNAIDPANSRSNSRKIMEPKHFTFDNSFWSHRTEDEHYAHQADVYNCLGEEFLDHNFEGYHTCIFAYGQTGSGKSYTMMGGPDQPGLIPRTCEDLFQRIESNASPSISYNVRVSYFEVYNEHVRDLLVPRQDPPYYLKIRESPTEGPYIKDLTDAPVKNFSEIMRYMTMGDNSRTTASTKMNDTSSRSHAVFTIMLKQIHHDMDTDETTERTARIRLVDLAGSERAKATEATGQRLREGSNINKSLTTLGRVIAALADPRHGRGGRKKDVVPYRDSILTWLLKDSLGGNSKTAMIACIAPSDYDETLSTLRYADQAKHIRTRAIVNQDHVSAAERDAQIADMQDTIRSLQLSVSQHAVAKRENDMQTLQLEEYQKQVAKMQRLMEETRQVSECKIKALQTQNEALRLHLKLAVDSLKNPIRVLPPGVDDKENVEREEYDEHDGSTVTGSTCTNNTTTTTSTSSSSTTDLDAAEQEMQQRMEHLLQDLGRVGVWVRKEEEGDVANNHNETTKERERGDHSRHWLKFGSTDERAGESIDRPTD